MAARVILESGGARHEVDVRADEAHGRRRVVIDGQTFDVERDGDGSVLRVRVGDCVETVHCLVDGPTIHLFWQGRAYRLTRATATARRPASGSLEAPMPGKVIAVSVTPGQTVTQGEALVIVEAMKMETVVRAPRDGRVRAVHVSVGERVAPGVVLVELE